MKVLKMKKSKKALTKMEKPIKEKPPVEESTAPFEGEVDEDGVLHLRLRMVSAGETQRGNPKFQFESAGGERFIPGTILDENGDTLNVLMPVNTILIVKKDKAGGKED